MFRKMKMWTVPFLLLCGVVIGCGQPAAGPAKEPASEAHDHAAGGPHGGAIIEMGDGSHAEMVHDDAAGKVTIYLLDGAAKNSVAADEAEISLAPSRLAPWWTRAPVF